MGCEWAMFRRKTDLPQLSVKGLLHVSQIPSLILNTYPQDAWMSLVWKNPDPGKYEGEPTIRLYGRTHARDNRVDMRSIDLTQKF
jgi:hypothetical protein